MSGWRAALVALVVGAVILGLGYLLPRLGNDSNGGPERPDDTSGVVLACSPVLRPACEGAARALDLSAISWKEGQALPDRYVLMAAADELPDGTGPGQVVARSPIVIGAWLERAQVLAAHCGVVDLGCITAALGSTWEEIGGNDAWGDFKLGLADPTMSEAGMLAWSLIAPVADPSALAQSLRLVTSDDASLTSDLVLFGDSRADVVITTEVAVTEQFENAIGRGGRLEIYYPVASPWMEYVAVAGGFGSGGVVDDLLNPDMSQVFADAGLRTTGGTATYPSEWDTPGTESPSPDEAARATLLEAWERIR